MAFKKIHISHYYTWNWNQLWTVLVDSWYTVPHWKAFIISSISMTDTNHNWQETISAFSKNVMLCNMHNKKSWIFVPVSSSWVNFIKWFIFTAWERIAANVNLGGYSTIFNNTVTIILTWEEITDV